MSILKPGAFALAEHKRNLWLAYPEPELTPKDCLIPAYWSSAAGMLRPYDRIEALAEDGAWWAECLVLDRGHNWAKVALMREVDLRKAATDSSIPTLPDDFYIKHRGVRGYSVLRKSDNGVLKEDMKTKEEASAWLGEYLKAMKL